MRGNKSFADRVYSSFAHRKRSAFLIGISAISMLLGAWSLSAPHAFENRPAGGKFLKLEAVMELPSASISAAWSPDSKKILVSLPYGFPTERQNIGAVLVDVDDKSITKLDATPQNGLDDIFWSPDGKYIATARGSHILLHEFPSLRVIARLEAEPPHSEIRCSFETNEGVQFTTDSRYLWVACNIWSGKPFSHFLMAVKLSVPDLKVVDRLVIPNPEPTKRVSERQYVSRQGDEIVLNSVLQIHGEKPFTGFQYVSCFLLEAKKPCYRPFQINELNIGSEVKHAPAYSVARQLGAVTVMGPIQEVHSRTIKRRHQLKLFHETIKKPISTIVPGTHSDVTSVGSPVFLKGGTFLFASAAPKVKDHESRLRSGLGVWRVGGLNGDLDIVQLIASPSHSARFLSPDGSQLAIIEGTKVYIYQFSDSVLSAGDKK